jgi:hypothetical protein
MGRITLKMSKEYDASGGKQQWGGGTVCRVAYV